MKTRPIVLALASAAVLLGLSGCTSTGSAGGKSHTVVLGGLFEMHEGAYDAQPPATFAVNGDKPAPGAALSGTKVSILWGLVSYRDQ